MTGLLGWLPLLWSLAIVTMLVTARAQRMPRPRLPRPRPLGAGSARAAVPPGGGAPTPPVTAVGRVDVFVGAVGRAALAPVFRRRGRELDPGTARQAGGVVLLAVAATAVHPLAGAIVAATGAAAPVVVSRRRQASRLARIEAELPDVVDLFLLGVDSGLTVPLAVAAVAERAPGELARELRVAVAEAERGRRLADALEDVPGRTAESVRPLVAALVASERYGTPVATALERLATEVRISAQRRAEEAARRVPVTLLFPLVLCILPAFALLTVAPLVANGLRSLRL